MANAIPTAYSRLISSINTSSSEIQKRSDSFSTGLKNPEMKDDIGGALLAQSLKTSNDFVGAAQKNADILDAMLKTHQQLIDTYLDTMSQMNVIALSMKSPQQASVRAAAEITFNELKSTATDIAANAGFAGINLMDGTFNSANQFTASNPVYNAVPTKSADLTTVTNLVSQRTGTLTVAVQPNAGDTITFGTGGNTVTFSFVDSNPDESLNQIVKGADVSGTALKMLKAFQSCTEDEMKKYTFSVAGAVLTITQKSVSSGILTTSDFNSSSTGARITQAFTAAAATGFDTDAYTANELIGQMGTFTVANTTIGATVYQTLQPYANASGLAAIPVLGANANAADVLVKFAFTIGTEDYNGYILHNDNGNEANSDNRIYCIKASDDVSGNNLTGKVFSIGLQANQDLATTASIVTLMNALNTDAALVTFKQSRYMTLNTNTLSNEYQGMSAVYTGTNFTGLSVNSVTCTSTTLTVNLINASSGATEAYTYSLSASPTIGAGTTITLTNSTSGATIDLVFSDIIDLTTDTSRVAFAQNLGTALGASGNSTFTIGTSADQTMTVDFADLRFGVITQNADLQIDNQTNAGLAADAIALAISDINLAKAKSASSSVKLEMVKAVMQITSFNLGATIESLTQVEVVDNFTRQSLEVSKVNSLIAAMQLAQSADRTINSILNG
ncbi:MAG: hypothetical protein EB127_06510 [Alphaproteobacteria bacterium]|nr:hypothetical protein [Alphaproteobacteria bacterium]